MSATISIQQVTGSGPTLTTITNLRFNTDDTANPGTSNPMIRPANVGDINRSYAKTIYLNADTTPVGTINNVKVFCDGAIGWTGCTLKIGTKGSYTQAAGTQGTTGTASSVATSNIERYTSSAPKQVTGSISNPNTGRISDYIVMQVSITSSAGVGTLNAENLSFQYDET